MARQGSTGNIRVEFVPGTAITNLAAPSVATDLSGSVNLTPEMRRNGLDTPRSSSTIDASDAASRQDKTAPGNIAAGTLTMRFQRDSVTADEDAWPTLAEETAGYLVVRRFGGSGVAFAAAQKVEVYQVTVMTREMQPIGDEVQNFAVTFSVEDQEQDATLAA